MRKSPAAWRSFCIRCSASRDRHGHGPLAPDAQGLGPGDRGWRGARSGRSPGCSPEDRARLRRLVARGRETRGSAELGPGLGGTGARRPSPRTWAPAITRSGSTISRRLPMRRWSPRLIRRRPRGRRFKRGSSMRSRPRRHWARERARKAWRRRFGGFWREPAARRRRDRPGFRRFRQARRAPRRDQRLRRHAGRGS